MLQSNDYSYQPLDIKRNKTKNTRPFLIITAVLAVVAIAFFLSRDLIKSKLFPAFSVNKKDIISVFSRPIQESSQSSETIKQRLSGYEGKRYVKEKLEMLQKDSANNEVVIFIQGFVERVNSRSVDITDYTNSFHRTIVIPASVPIYYLRESASSILEIFDLSKIKEGDFFSFSTGLVVNSPKAVLFVNKQ